MEVELGLKITRIKDDTTSISDFQFAKDRAGPVFLSKETDATFTLTAHLKGFFTINTFKLCYSLRACLNLLIWAYLSSITNHL